MAASLPEPCGAPAEDKGVDPWAVGAEGDGLEVGEGLELEVGVGYDAEADACSEVDAGSGAADRAENGHGLRIGTVLTKVGGSTLGHPCPTGHHVGLELEAAGEVEVPEAAGKGAVEGSDCP